MSRTRILVADDHDVVRQGVRALLETRSDWEICGEAVNGREAVEAAARLVPDIVVMDITMPELNGIDAARQILRAAPRTEILILTMHQSEQLIREVVNAGARGYVLKSDAGRSLVSAVQALSQHEPFLTSQVTEVVLERYRQEASQAPAGQEVSLTPREREVAQLLAEGRSTRQVAASLGLSVKTAEAHRASIFHKLRLHSVTELVRYAIRAGLIQG